MASSWLPEIARSEPRRLLRARYRAVPTGCPAVVPPGWQHTVDNALHAAGVTWCQTDTQTWEVLLPWTTLVLALVRRNVEERLVLRLVSTSEGATLELHGLPVGTHAAHAVGFAGVLVIAAIVWVATGWITGAPAGLATALAGGLWASATREIALTTLERRVRRLLDDVGQALWPGAPAELISPSLSGPGR